MIRLLAPPALLFTLSACIIYKDGRHDDWDDDDACWDGDIWVCDEHEEDEDPACWDGRRWTECGDDAPDEEEDTGEVEDRPDDVGMPSELGLVLTPEAGPRNLTFIASLLSTGDVDMTDVVGIGFTSQDPKSILPAIIAQQPRSDTERLLTISVPTDADLGVIDAYITFSDNDYVVVERIFEVLPEGEDLRPWDGDDTDTP